MALLFMVILPQINLRETMISQAANGLQRDCVFGKEKAAGSLSGGQDAASLELNIDPLDGYPEALCQLGYCQMVGNRRPPCSMPHLEAVFKTNAPDCDRQNFISLLWRVMSFLRQNARDLIVVGAIPRQCVYAFHHLLVTR